MRRIVRPLALFLLMWVSCARCDASTAPFVSYHWRSVVVGAGGFAPDLIFSPAETGLAYLRTDMGGAYRWDLQLKHWIPLEDQLAQGSYMGIESLAADPSDPNVVYLAAGMYDRDPAAILRSQDRGRHWTVNPVPFRMGGNEDGRGLGERLAIDPNRTSLLLFGSRHDGLQRSDDSGRTWRKVASFPWAGLGQPQPRTTHAGISFVLFDPASGSRGSASRVIYAAVADPAPRHLYRSSDGGRTWSAVPGGPDPSMLPVKGAIDPEGILYVDYCTGIGPNGIGRGAVWKLDTRSGRWTDITPDPASEGGYMGLSLDRQRIGRIAVSTVDRWHPGDTVWLSNDSGAHWKSLREHSSRNVSESPFLKFAKSEADFGHWIAGLAFNPFDGHVLAYTTGATVYRTDDVTLATSQWVPWVKGIEQTAIIALISPTAGAPLISGFGDITGFTHDRLDQSPSSMFLNPRLPNTNNLDYSGASPNVVVRSGSLQSHAPQEVTLAWSEDGGHDWHPLEAPPVKFEGERAARIDTLGDAPVVTSARGSVFVVSGPVALATSDHGRSWWMPAGLPQNARVVSDKSDDRLFYAIDYAHDRLFVSVDGARTFDRVSADGLPPFQSAEPRNRESPSALIATPGSAGSLWLLVDGRLYRSNDRGKSFIAATGPEIQIELFGLGKAAPGQAHPALYVLGSKDSSRGIWRSIDGGKSWARINDEDHQWGLRIRALTGDPRRFGRVYIGTDGRGILYGDPRIQNSLR